MVPSVAPCRTCTALDILHAGRLVTVSNSLTKRDFVVGNPSGKETPAFAARLLPDPAREGGGNRRPRGDLPSREEAPHSIHIHIRLCSRLQTGYQHTIPRILLMVSRHPHENTQSR